MQASDKTRLTNTISVAQYRQLEAAGDREACGQFIIQRFEERYFAPALGASPQHGFTLMAVSCLVIEAIECFHQGKSTSRGHGASEAMFKSFFSRDHGLREFVEHTPWFYKNIRCGILHQAETTGGWRLLRSGALLDVEGRAINALTFARLLQRAVNMYGQALSSDERLWANFRKKMDGVCINCEHPN